MTTALARPAGAVEREHHLGVDAGPGVLVLADKSTTQWGGGAGAHYKYGLSDEFDLLVEGSASLLSASADAGAPATRPARVAQLGAGLGYVFDVLRWVPYAGVLVGGYALAGGTIASTELHAGGAIALGLDYRVNRSLAVGVAARQHMILPVATYPSFTQVFARAEYTWGW